MGKFYNKLNLKDCDKKSVEVWEVKLQHKGDIYPIIFHFLNKENIPPMSVMKTPTPIVGSIADVTIGKTFLNVDSEDYKWCLMNSY